MSRPPASSPGTARFAVVGAESNPGHALREALAKRRVPGGRVNLYGTSDGEAVISEYDGEARLIQDPDIREISAHEVVFLCEAGELARNVVEAVGIKTVVIDLIGCVPDRYEPRLAHPGILPDALDVPHGFYAVPHPFSLLLAELMVELDRGFGIREVVGTILRPAADFGEAGVDELRRQAVGLLSFSELPVETFGSQLAFNVIRSAEAQGESDLRARISREVSRLLDWDAPRTTISLVTVPVFHGHTFEIRVRFEAEVSSEQVRERLDSARFVEVSGDALPASPVEVTGELRTVVVDVRSDGLGGVWVAAVAGEASSRCAFHALLIADRVAGL